MNLEDTDDIIGGSISQRPIGVKRAKLKRKTDDQTSMLVNNIEEGTRQLLEQLKKASTQRELFLETQQTKEENKILLYMIPTYEHMSRANNDPIKYMNNDIYTKFNI